MKLTRRNALIGLGTVAAGAGVVGGTGAFTTATADRSINVSTVGDTDGAAIEIEIDPDGLHDELSDNESGDDGAVVIDFSGLNVDTRFTFAKALRVNPQNADSPVDVSISNAPTGIGFELDTSSTTLDTISGTTPGTNTFVGVPAGTNLYFDMIVNLIDQDASDVSGNIEIEITEN